MIIQNLKLKIKNTYSKKITLAILLGIIIIAVILRFWQLGSTPNGLDWDEAALGYNAYSILHTGKDEYGVTLPIVLKSFGDYKPALFAYLDIPSIAVFGLTPFAVRLPSAVLGVITVMLVFFLVKELFKRNVIALLSSFLLAISPWHIQFSRVAFETNVGVFFNMLGALLFLKGLKKPWLLSLSVISFVLSLYVYQSEKVFTPLLVILLIILFRKEIFSVKKSYVVLAGVIGLVMILPILFYTLFSANGLARAQGVSIFSSQKLNQEITRRYEYNKTEKDMIGLVLDNKRLVYAKQIIGNYISHFDPNWLFITGDISRHHAPGMGLLYLWELPFVAIGLYQLLFGKYDKKAKLFLFGWLLLAPVPAAITQDVPHAVRTMNMVVAIEMLSALGFLGVLVWLGKRKILLGLFISMLFVAIAYNFLYYLDQYFVQQNYFNSLDWQYGYPQIVSSTELLGNHYQHIVVDSTGQFSQSYIFYLFYGKVNPGIYQTSGNQDPSEVHRFGKYTFRPINWDKDKYTLDTLFVGNPSDFPTGIPEMKKVIGSPDKMPLAEFVSL